MEFRDFKSLRRWIRCRLVGCWEAFPGAVQSAVTKTAPIFTLRFWRELPARLMRAVWNGIVFVAHLLQAAVHNIVRFPFVRRAIVTVILVFLGSWAVLAVVAYLPSRQVEPDQPEHRLYYLDQGWGKNLDSKARQTFYYTPQGTSLLATGFRYSWFVNLEQNHVRRLFRDPEHMRALGFEVDNVSTDANPDQLPVGFTRHYAPEFNDQVLDITCAACHTGELHVPVHGVDSGIRIDGGQGMHAFTSTSFGQFGSTLSAAMGATLLHPLKFRRFAQAVLKEQFRFATSIHLYADMVKVMSSMLSESLGDAIHRRYPVDEGFGRTDAIGRIANRAFGTDLDPINFAPGNAPVSYPAIWDAHYWDWVQYGASVAQPMARNIGESFGVGATLGLVDDYGRPLIQGERFVTGTLIENLKPSKTPSPIWNLPNGRKISSRPSTEKSGTRGKAFQQALRGLS